MIIEDSEADYELLTMTLRRAEFEAVTERVQDEPAMREALRQKTWDIVFSDYGMPNFDAFKALAVLREGHPETPFIIVSGTIGEERAAEAMRAGANDYVLKGHRDRLIPAVRRELAEAESKKRRRELEAQLKQKEEEVRQLKKMEELGRLAGAISHDFNNILGIIGLTCDMQLDELAKDDPLRPCLEQILKAQRSGAALTRQLLAFSRNQPVAPKVLNVNEVFTGSKELMVRLLGEGIEVTTKLAPDLHNTLIDQGQLEQVILNLIVNARDAMANGGKLKIETRNTVIDKMSPVSRIPVEPGNFVVLSVTDTGCGMDAETASKIFEPFFTTKERGKGTGLGLATVFGVVKGARGTIVVDTKPGVGTSFLVFFPATREALTPALGVAPEKTAKSMGEISILVVEDGDELREGLCIVLRKQGYKVIEASNGEEGIQVAEEHKGALQLLVTDLVMPRVGGQELAAKVLQQRPDTRVLYLSGYTNQDLMTAGVPPEHVHFLEKPFRLKELTDKVKDILARVPAQAAAQGK